MSAVDDGATDVDAQTPTTPRDRRLTATGLLGDAARRAGRSPVLLLPFLVAGLVLAGVDYLRVRDPVPVQVTPYSLSEGFTVRASLYPTGTSRTTTALDALVDLKLQYLAWVVGLELLSVLAVVVAGGVVVARVTDVPLSVGSVVRYGAFVVALAAVPSVNFSGASAVVGLVLLVPAYYVSVRLFALPALLIRGDGFRTAARRSWTLVAGIGWSVFGLLVALGVVYSLSALVPVVGPALSTTVAGTLHAVALGLLVDRARSGLNAAGASNATTNPANPSD
ncbi:hypothetical protein SAMN04487948_105150 [Halogranum amylolyticum]|uniref:Uncharacterized protein n=1 Tax=Halogranum amylolyticum TaxID=660520 RepID=A0A1H8SK67_9EURY|nr:hypothetical protein [Halogranum amylolyticum]SEO78916.1 hypothetical protein SAMN04487948_105150 [Halogranum amylolyticum]